MASEETEGTPIVDKGLVKEALQEILNEIPAFRAFIQQGDSRPPPAGNGSTQTDNPQNPKDNPLDSSSRGKN